MVVSDHYLKKYSCNPNQTWCIHLFGEYSELICFWVTLAKFWRSSGHKMTENGGFRPLSEKTFDAIQFKFGVYTYWVSVQNWFTFWSCWPIFDALLATKWLKLVVSDCYLKKYSSNPIQIWRVHLFGECSVLIHFWATLAKFWCSTGQKITENGGFWPLSEMVLMQSNSNLMCTLTGWVFRTDSLLGHIGQILAL